jgi:hypothetical protein
MSTHEILSVDVGNTMSCIDTRELCRYKFQHDCQLPFRSYR